MRNKEFLNFLKSAMLKERELTSDRIAEALSGLSEKATEYMERIFGDQYEFFKAEFNKLSAVAHSQQTRLLEEATLKLDSLKDGEKGEPGSIGPQGIQGEKGEAGLRGDAGADGNHGLDGSTGEKGDPGIAGEPGPVGKDGADGLPGPTGADGADGVPGRDGIDKYILTPRQANGEIQLEKNDLVYSRGGVFQAIRKTPGNPEKEPSGFNVLINGVAQVGYIFDKKERTLTHKTVLTDGASADLVMNDMIRVRKSKDDGMADIDGDVIFEGEGYSTYDAANDAWNDTNLKGDQGIRGRKGIKGEPGEKGEPGVGLADIMTHEGQLVFVLTDGSHKTVDLTELLGA